MKKQILSKLTVLIILFLFMVSSGKIINKNNSNEIKEIKSYMKYFNIKDFFQLVPLPIVNNYYIYVLYEFENDNDKKELIKGEISIGRPSGGD